MYGGIVENDEEVPDISKGPFEPIVPDAVIGTLGEVPDRSYLVTTVEDVDRLELPDSGRVRYLTQTTLSLDDTSAVMDALRRRFPAIQAPLVRSGMVFSGGPPWCFSGISDPPRMASEA